MNPPEAPVVEAPVLETTRRSTLKAALGVGLAVSAGALATAPAAAHAFECTPGPGDVGRQDLIAAAQQIAKLAGVAPGDVLKVLDVLRADALVEKVNIINSVGRDPVLRDALDSCLGPSGQAPKFTASNLRLALRHDAVAAMDVIG